MMPSLQDALQRSRRFAEVLSDLDEVRHAIGHEGLEQALVPSGYLGITDRLIDRALAAHEQLKD